MPEFTLGPFLPVAEGVWRAVAMPDAVTIGLVAGSESALVVDTGSHPDQGREILAAAQAVAGVPVRDVVVTHAHRDHLFGLAAFDGIESLGHDTIAERLTASDTLAEAAALGVATDDLRAPSIGFSLARTRDLGGLRVEIVHLGRGHTEGDLVVILPERGVIFVGDLVESAGPPSFGPDCDLGEWAKTLDSLIGLVPPDGIVVVGHGEPVNREFVQDQWARIGALYSQVAQFSDRGIAAENALAKGSWLLPDEVVTAVLPLAYAQWAAKRRVRPPRQLPLLGHGG